MATNLSNLEDFFSENHITKKKTNNSLPIECTSSISEILKKAKELHINTDPLDIYAVVKKIFHIEIKEDKFGKNVSGFLERIGEKWCIFINQNESNLRKRFTIAHELGHFVKHRDKYMISGSSIPDLIFFRDNTIDPIEKEANDFAADLLMPKDVFIEKIKSGYNTLDKLSEAFQLSTSAVKYRAYKLGLISEYM